MPLFEFPCIYRGFSSITAQKAIHIKRFRRIQSSPKPPSKITKQPLTYKTRNQVVAQAAHGFESHPVRQRKAGESNRFTGFYFICGYLISSHNSKSISLIYYPQRHPAYFCFQSRAAGSTFIYQNRTPFIRHCSLTSGVRFTFTGDYRKDQVRLILSIRSSSLLVKDVFSIAFILSMICDGFDAPIRTELTIPSFSTHASAISARV